jgi:tRNA U34 5-methylaminomethyl-2-thiouridine-forming methyltransferase MnmC
MKRELLKTQDGSMTIYIPEMDENYHSGHGAFREAIHVFIQNGLRTLQKNEIRIFEMGFGTGLNALLTLQESMKSEVKIDYSGIEAYPVDLELIEGVKYGDLVQDEASILFPQLHLLAWNESHDLTANFKFKKLHEKIEDHIPEMNSYDLIYFDAFGPRAQGEMWELPVLKKMYDMLKTEGVLVTYCAKGQFKRDLRSLGFETESLPGPPGKREMTRAVKR